MIVAVFLFARQPLQQFQDYTAGRRVQIAGRLIGQQDPRRMDQRPRDRHALHLPTGKLVRIAVAQTVEFHPVQIVLAPFRAHSDLPASSSGSSTFS